MKARDYFDKYLPAVDGHSPKAIQLQVMRDFQDEFHELCRQRSASSRSARNGIIRELNEKWNAVAHLFETRTGKAVLEMGAFVRQMCKDDADMARSITSTGTRMPNWYDAYRAYYNR